MVASTKQTNRTEEVPQGVLDAKEPHCHHCGNKCEDERIAIGNKVFCCEGCKTVYEILSSANLCEYYQFEDRKLTSLKNTDTQHDYAFLENREIAQRILTYSDGKTAQVVFYIPAIHCSSCIYLLEHLYKLDKGVLHSQTDFLKKTVKITFQEEKTTLKNLANLLAKLGYAPHITLENADTSPELVKKTYSKAQKDLIARIAVAGFCFGNIMLISFPEYFGFDSRSHSFKNLFGYLNIVLSLPAFFYSGNIYLSSAYQNLRKGILNIDFPLALGMVVLLVRSWYEILSETGAGYLDTLAGLVFFLLVGRWFQQKTYDTLRYDRDFKSYFPISVTTLEPENKSIEKLDLLNCSEKQILASSLQKGDWILIRHQELIPADAILLKGKAIIDYSFVTGEAIPVERKIGEMIYAGGRQMGEALLLEVIKPVSQSHLTSLWNHESFQKKRESKSFQTVLSQYFTVVLLSIATLSVLYWGIVVSDWSRAINAFSAVLIIACPCALALSSPFALGTAMRMLGRWKFYLKNAHVVEELAKATSFVFDKTGTITEHHFARLKFVGKLSEEEKRLIKSVVKNSLHPLSMAIVQQLVNVKIYEVTDFHEIPGKGVIGKVQNRILRIGAESFVKQTSELPSRETTVTTVHVQIDDDYKGYFEFANTYREGIAEMILQLLRLKNYSLHVLSGDNDREKDNLRLFFGEETTLRFHQSPHDKREYVAALQEKGERVVMLGDGLNDAGALQQSQVGIAVTENTAFFTPAADVIMEASVLKYLPRFVRFCQQTMSVLKWSFVISLVYNIIGLFFAVQGTLSPLIAAVLMPISSITIIAFTTLTVSGLTKNWNKN